ncbi:MAG: hypothetical protein WCC36_09685 [Gammaproteobacteria bacterium]
MNIKRLAMPAMVAALIGVGAALPGLALARDHGHFGPQVSARQHYDHGRYRPAPRVWRHTGHHRDWDHRWHRREFHRSYRPHYHSRYYRPYYDADDRGRGDVIIRYHYYAD